MNLRRAAWVSSVFMPMSTSISRRRNLWLLASCILGGLATAAGCRRHRRSREDQVRDTITSLARAVEEKDLKTIRGLVSERYHDAEEHDRPEMIATLRMIFARYPAIHLLTRVTAIDLDAASGGGGTPARVKIIVAMASLPMTTMDDLFRLHADVNQFDLVLTEQAAEQWTVIGAAWQAARPQDLF